MNTTDRTTRRSFVKVAAMAGACAAPFIVLLAPLTVVGAPEAASVVDGLYFPPPGQGLKNQDRRGPKEVGLDAAMATRINRFVAENPYTRTKVTPRWALWRHGRLVHVEGDFHKTVDVASLRKTWHAMIVGAAIKQKKIPSHHQKISQWLPELKGNDAQATWRHVITQSAGFDYPDRFAESPYGYLTWVNTDRDYFPDADCRWAWGSGAGGTKVLWNRANGIVFAGVGIEMAPKPRSIPYILDTAVTGPNPLSTPAAVRQVGQWDRFEAAVVNTRRYNEPYTDVTLNVTYTRPDGGTIAFRGFHDGAAIWRFRFMPDQIGRWKYRAEFSDGSGRYEGEFHCVASSVPGMISEDEANPIWFGFKGGKHVLIRSFHAGDRFFAGNWPASKRRAFLDWAQAQGYNMLSVASHYLNRGERGRGQGWETPDLWPLNAAGFRKLELMLDELADRRMIVYPFAGFFGQQSDFPTAAGDQEQYIRYALARLGPYWNVVFNVAGPEPLVHPQKFGRAMSIDDIRRLGRTIASLDPFGHLLSIHNGTGDDPFRDEAWASFTTLQGCKNADWARINERLRENHHPSKPLYAQEVFWPGNQYHGKLTDDEIRKKAFVLLMSGAAVNFGDMNGNSSSGFSGTLELSDRVQRRHDVIKQVWDFFERVPFHRMKPRQDLVDNGFCLAEAGVDHLVYLPDGGSVNVGVERGKYRVEWINARNPADRRAATSTATGRNLASPADGQDWLLRLVRLDKEE